MRAQAEPAGHVLDRLLAHGDSSMWEHRACGADSKGLRLHDWSTVTVSGQDPAPGYAHTLLIRRSATHPDEVEYFLAHALRGTAIPELISAAGMRWKIEKNNETGKDQLDLTQYQVRS